VFFNDSTSGQGSYYLQDSFSSEWMKFSIPTYIFSDWNRNSKEDIQVCLSIWSIMLPECIPKPTKKLWSALEFEIRANFPHCLGAVVGKHIREIKTEHSGSMFSCYKDFFPVVLIAVAYTNYTFVYVDIGTVRKRL
jgi:hypothetical protein